MKTINDRFEFFQKGFSPIYLIVVIVVVGVAIFAIVNFKGANKISPVLNQQLVQISSNSPTTNSGITLEKIEDKAYVFYYPQGFTRDQLIKGDDSQQMVQSYSNAKTGNEGISLTLELKAKKLSIPNYQDCLTYAEKFREKAEDEIKVETIVRGREVGCKIVMKQSIGTDTRVGFNKRLWKTDGSDDSIYNVDSMYLVNSSKDYAQKIEQAVDQFTLK